MKKSFMTRVLATGLSLAMALSLSTATNLVSAQAAPAMLVDAVSGESTSTLTVDVDTVAKLKINPEVSKTYKVESVKKSSKKIKTAVNKKGTVVYVRGMAATGEKDSAIRVYFKVKKTGKTAKRQFTAKVKVVEATPVVEVAKITEATQKETKKVAVKFSTAVESVKPTDFTITKVDGSVVIPVKGAVIDADKTGAMIETYTDMKDGKEYTITYTAADEAKTVSTVNFTATDAKVAKLAISTTTIPANDSTEVKINTLDAQGVLLGSYKFSDLAQQKITAEIKCSNNGYKDGDKIYLKNAGDTAEIKTVLHTYQYENGVEKDTIPETFIVTAVDETYAGYTFGYSLVKAGSGEPAWNASSYKQNTATPVKEDAVAFFNFKNAAGTNRNSKFSISSADNNVLLVGGGKADQANGMSVKGVKEGSTYLLVKDEKGSLVASLPVSVNAARKASRLELSTQSVSVSNAASQAAIDVWPTVYDQYNEKMSIDSIDFKALTVASTSETVLKTSGKKFVVTGAGVAANHTGTYYYELKATSNNVTVTNNLSVNVSKPSGTVETYGVEVESATVDLATDETSTASKGAVVQKIRIARYQGGVLKDYLSTASISSITVKGTNNEGDISSKVASDGAVMTITCGAVSGAGTSAGPFAQLVKTGTYSVEVTIKTSDKATATFANTFAVKNDQAAKYAKNVKKTDVSDKYGVNDIQSIASNGALMDKDVFEITKDAAGISGKYTLKAINSTVTTTNNDKTVYVESVEADIEVNGDNHIYLVIPVQYTFTCK
ncbi:MAG: hypothetical protein SO019_05740 [Lachnospiraceae bacterium]|nr:hypothetical protein [Lachnospiraceae bacterium]